MTRSPPPLELDESANDREMPVALGQTIALSLSENGKKPYPDAPQELRMMKRCDAPASD